METLIHDDLVDSRTAASILGLKNPNTLAVWRSTGRYKLPFVKVGGLVRYRRADLHAWLQARTHSDGATR